MEFQWPAGVYYCPRDKNHKVDSKDRLIKHLSNCKLLKGYPEFYSCAFDTYHLFVSPFEKEAHEQVCLGRSKAENPEDLIASSSFMFANPGFDEKFVPKKVDSQFYNKNKERLEREDKEIKEIKAKIRINVADMKKSSAAGLDENTVSLNIQFEDAVLVRLALRVTNLARYEEVCPEFDSNSVYLAAVPQDKLLTAFKAAADIAGDTIGELVVDTGNQRLAEQLDLVRRKVVEFSQVYTLKDKKENIFCVVSSDALQEEAQTRLSLKPRSLAVVWLLKSDLFKTVLSKSAKEKELLDENSLKSNESSRLSNEIRETQETINGYVKKAANSSRVNENLKRELSTLTMRLVKEDESSSQANIARFTSEIETLKSAIAERQEKFQEELAAVKNQKMSEYLKVLVDCLLSSNDKLQVFNNHISKYEENIGSLEAYNKDSEKLSESWKQSISDYESSLEDIKDKLNRSKDSIADDNLPKKGVICHKDLHCHMCKSTYASVVTKPCNHCILCWSCFHGFVQTGLRGCLLCDKRIDYVFKIKFI